MKQNDVNESKPMKQNKLSHFVQCTHWHMSVDIPSCMVAEPLILDCWYRVVMGADGRCETTVNERGNERSSDRTLCLQRPPWYTQSRLSKLAEGSETVTDFADGESATRTAVCNAAVLSYWLSQKGARKISWKGGNNGVEAYTQLCLVYGTSDHEGRS